MGNVMKAIGSIFSPQKMKMPEMKPPAAMPDPASPAARMVARDKIEKRRARGREGTIYTGGTYSNQNLGGTQ